MKRLYNNIRISDSSVMTVNGGTVNGHLTMIDESMMTVNGGMFSFDSSEYVDADTHAVTENDDNTWTVE